MSTAEQLESARNFPDNTCPASRHAQLLAESLLACKKPRWSIDEPNHCGESIAAVVTWLYQARDRIEALAAENAALRVTCEEVEQKRNMQEQEPVAHLWQHGETGRRAVRMPDEVFTVGPAWQYVGPLYLHSAPALLEALHHISLCSQNSMSSQRQCGEIARAAIAAQKGTT